MTGLFDTFRRHYAVLTNFTEYDVESRPYWPGGGNPSPPADQRPEGAGPACWVGRMQGGRSRGRYADTHPLQAPAGPSGARFAGICSA